MPRDECGDQLRWIATVTSGGKNKLPFGNRAEASMARSISAASCTANPASCTPSVDAARSNAGNEQVSRRIVGIVNERAAGNAGRALLQHLQQSLPRAKENLGLRLKPGKAVPAPQTHHLFFRPIILPQPISLLLRFSVRIIWRLCGPIAFWMASMIWGAVKLYMPIVIRS